MVEVADLFGGAGQDPRTRLDMHAHPDLGPLGGEHTREAVGIEGLEPQGAAAALEQGRDVEHRLEPAADLAVEAGLPKRDLDGHARAQVALAVVGGSQGLDVAEGLALAEGAPSVQGPVVEPAGLDALGDRRDQASGADQLEVGDLDLRSLFDDEAQLVDGGEVEVLSVDDGEQVALVLIVGAEVGGLAAGGGGGRRLTPVEELDLAPELAVAETQP